MDQELKKKLTGDPDGLQTYEYLANNIETCGEIMPELVDNMVLVDRTGQFTASAARYLHAIDREKYASEISRLVKAVIDKDRERRYLVELAQAFYGPDYEARAEELSASDDNFRRIYKRLHPVAGM